MIRISSAEKYANAKHYEMVSAMRFQQFLTVWLGQRLVASSVSGHRWFKNACLKNSFLCLYKSWLVLIDKYMVSTKCLNWPVLLDTTSANLWRSWKSPNRVFLTQNLHKSHFVWQKSKTHKSPKPLYPCSGTCPFSTITVWNSIINKLLKVWQNKEYKYKRIKISNRLNTLVFF